MPRLFLLILACALLAPIAKAQSEAPSMTELRKQNDAHLQTIAQLEAKVAQLEASLAELAQQLEASDAEADRLRGVIAQLAANPGVTDQTPAPTSVELAEEQLELAPIPEDEPLSSPQAMLLAAQSSFEAVANAIDYDPEKRSELFNKDFQRWNREISRELVGDPEWLIQVIEPRREGSNTTLTFRVFDPTTRRPFSAREFPLEVNSRLGRKLTAADAPEMWIMRARVAFKPILNYQRAEMGFFDIPPYIGKFVEFSMVIQPQSLIEAPAELQSIALPPSASPAAP